MNEFQADHLEQELELLSSLQEEGVISMSSGNVKLLQNVSVQKAPTFSFPSQDCAAWESRKVRNP